MINGVRYENQTLDERDYTNGWTHTDRGTISCGDQEYTVVADITLARAKTEAEVRAALAQFVKAKYGASPERAMKRRLAATVIQESARRFIARKNERRPECHPRSLVVVL
jgi:hypothetical protein